MKLALHPTAPGRGRPRRFRTRLLAAMLTVALIPLAAFVGLVVADLGSMSRTTVDETHRTILDDARGHQLSDVTDRAKLVDVRLTTLSGDVRQLRNQLAAHLTPQQAAPRSTLPQVYLDHGLTFAPTPDGQMTVVVGSSDRVQSAPIDRALALTGPAEQIEPIMQGLLHTYPEVESVWVGDQAGNTAVFTPPLDVPRAIRAGQLVPGGSLGLDTSILSNSQKEFSAANGQAAWINSDAPPKGSVAGAYWTDPYPTRQAGDEGVTVWMPLGDGRTVVGADISLSKLTSQALSGQISGDPNAYAMLLSSSNRVLAADSGIQKDFGVPPTGVGTVLPTATDRTFAQRLANVTGTGSSTILDAHLGGVDKEVFTAPIYAAHWTLTITVPLADLQPDVIALTRGIDAGIRDVLLEAIPVALVLLLLAFGLARFFARRLVGPVNALTVAAGRLADGHTHEPVPPQGEDEVGVLAASLERMRREINSSRDAILAGARQLEIRVADRTAELRVRNDELVALNELAGSLTRSLDPDVIVGEALAAVRAIVPLRRACGFLLDRGDLRPVAGDVAAGPAPGPIDGEGMRMIAAAAVDEGGIVRAGVEGGETLVGLPLAASDGIAGALALTTALGADIDAATPLLRAIADQVGLALRTARLSAEGRATAVLEERTRLAREIHDTLAQQLTGIVLQLEAAEAYVAGDAAGREAVVLARDLARSALQEARRSVWDLRPTPLAATGLVAALQSEVRTWSDRTGIVAHTRAEHVPRTLSLQPRAEVALLRITQEALGNIARHSEASRVNVRLRGLDDNLELTIHDDGRGFDPSPALRRADAFGLVGMAERARLAGGTFDVDSRPGAGTRLRVRVPLGDATASRTGAQPPSLVPS